MSLDDEWREEAVCRTVDPILFDAEQDGRRAARICHTCPVEKECLLDALTTEPEGDGPWGVRGGLTATERRHLTGKDRVAAINALRTTIRQGATP